MNAARNDRMADETMIDQDAGTLSAQHLATRIDALTDKRPMYGHFIAFFSVVMLATGGLGTLALNPINDKLSELKTQIAEAKSDLKAQIAEAKSDLKAQVTEAKSDLAVRIAQGKAEMETRVAEMASKSAVDQRFAEITTQLANIRPKASKGRK